MDPKQTIDGAHLIIGMDPATGTVVVLKNRRGPVGGAVIDAQQIAIQSVLTGDYARTLAVISALVEKIEDNPALFFGAEDTCADEFQEAQELLAKVAGTTSPADDKRTFEARQMLGDIRAHAAGME